MNNPPTLSAVVLCAGKGERTGLPYNKVLHRIGSKTVLEQTLDTFTRIPFERITVVVPNAEMQVFEEIIKQYPNVCAVTGGATRAESALNGLLAYRSDIVVIHDGARPYTSKELILRSIASAAEYGSGVAAVRCTDTVKRIDDSGKIQSLDRSRLFNMQTPQTFEYDRIVQAYRTVKELCTDDAEVYERAGYEVKLVDGEYSNIKITTAGDLFGIADNCRIGVGFDVHRLVEGRPLVLGGVKIDYSRGLLGHSDADVLIHAIMDALLSAANYPDIGVLFPDTDDKYLGISSVTLLEEVVKLVRDKYAITNVSAVIAAQKPKLAPIIPQIRKKLASVLGIDISRINVSATTTEGLGIIGSGDAIAADASCILTENNRK